MADEKKAPRPKFDLEADAQAALQAARTMPPGPERTEAIKKAGNLRNAAEPRGYVLRSAEGLRKHSALVATRPVIDRNNIRGQKFSPSLAFLKTPTSREKNPATITSIHSIEVIIARRFAQSGMKIALRRSGTGFRHSGA